MSSTVVSRRAFSTANCLLDRLLRRNLISNIYPESSEYRVKLKGILEKPTTVYAGFDATSSSLHIGNLATIMNLLYFHRNGHRVICVVGNATTHLGDPSGHTRDRSRIDSKSIENNSRSIEETIERLFRNHDSYFSANNEVEKKPIIVRNSEWYKGKNVIDFVSEIFREVRVGGLLHKKSISERLRSNEGMNMSEFCYQIFQAYDWMELQRLYDCRLQIGGSDQAGNIYTGHDLIKRIRGSSDYIGLLAPIITSSRTGKKLGKTGTSREESVWLRPEETSPFDLYQYFHKTPDNDVDNYLKVFTFLDEETIEDLVRNHLKKREDVWYCQRKLAENVCKLVHGQEGLSAAETKTRAIFGRG